MSQSYRSVARVGEIAEGACKVIYLDDVAIAVFHIAGHYHAIEDICTHDGGPLAEGYLEGCIIECPRHGAKFDVRTGAVVAMPAMSPVPSYAVRVEGDEIQVEWS